MVDDAPEKTIANHAPPEQANTLPQEAVAACNSHDFQPDEPPELIHAGGAIAPLSFASREPSIVARGLLLFWLALIVYASLYPFSGWQKVGIPLWHYLVEPVPPRYWTWFDLGTNMVGYMPLGILTIYALYPAVRGMAALLLACTLGILLPATMEVLQSFLPTRVTSNMDWLANSIGAIIGAAIGVASSRSILEHSTLRDLRQRWFVPNASRGMTVMLLWPLTQIYPQSCLFGNGSLLPLLSNWLQLDPAATWRNAVQLSAMQYWQLEILITAFSCAGALLAWSHMLRKKMPRILLVFLMLTAALGIKTLSMALLFQPQNALAWLSEGAQLGLWFGIIITTVFIWLPLRLQRYAALMLLAASFLTINMAPVNPYFAATLETWVQGRFLHFNGAAQFLSLIWPLLAFWFLLRPTTRRRAFFAPEPNE